MSEDKKTPEEIAAEVKLKKVEAKLKEAEIKSFLALNCSLISDKTNISIGRKDPLIYMKDRYQWTSEEIVQQRLQSHLIPIPELSNGGYEV